MMKKLSVLLSAVAALMLVAMPMAQAGVDGENIFKKKCSICHKVDKKKFGPALKDMNTDIAVLKATVTNGRKSMPKFSKKLTAEEIDAVVAFVASKNPHAVANPCAANPCAAKNPCAANPCAAK
ncbi:MAG: cytochrome c [Mariprofundaceae bacterium]|nr:cytochrome c [Mariprofundaceae bacterium]